MLFLLFLIVLAFMIGDMAKDIERLTNKQTPASNKRRQRR